MHDERYVANPANGSGHNRGIAVDLTIIDLKTGKELNMGTGFDNFTDSAHHSFTNLPKEILQNRNLLKTTMEKYGFKLFETEWWHYFLADGDKYEVLDIDFKKLGKKNEKIISLTIFFCLLFSCHITFTSDLNLQITDPFFTTF